VSFAALAGLGLVRELPAVTAIAVAASALLLASLGFARLLGGRLPTFGPALAGAAAAMLTLMPLYQPGERAAATRQGLELLGAPSVVRESVIGWLRLFGSDRTPAVEPVSPPIADWVAVLPAEPTRKEAPRAAAPLESRPESSGADETLRLRRSGEHLLVSAHLESRHGADDLLLTLDTGAAITTLTRRAAEAVELELSGDSPVVFLNGVGGRSEARLTVVEALWLGEEAVGPLTVAVCDDCLPGEGEGLLGIDVLGHFATEIDAEALRLGLRRSPRVPPRDLVAPFLDLDARLEIRLRSEVLGEIEVRNRAPVDAREVRVALECPHETFEFGLETVPSRGAERIEFALPWGTPCQEFRASVAFATWY
jgi:hypothetical protein